MERTERKMTGGVLAGQLLAIAAVVLAFALLWAVIWLFVTSRCVSDVNDEMRIKMIDVSRNLPFDGDSRIVHRKAEPTLEGDLPVLDCAAALFPMVSAFTEALYPEESVVYDRESGEFDPASALQFHNTVRGFNALVDGTVDVFFSSYPSAEQLASAEEAGVELVFVPIGKEAFVFLVNRKNPVGSLTQEELRGLFTGKYTNWKQVGGADRPVHPIKRIAGSGSQGTLQAFLHGEEVYTNPLGFMGASIGYSFRWYTTEVVKEGNVRILSVDGVYPDEETITDGTYPLTTCFYAMYRKENEKENVRILLDYILSEEGQTLIGESGYCGIG